MATDGSPAAPQPQVAALAVRLPPFWPADPQLWFAQIESQFALRRITDQQTRFHHVVSALSSADAAEVRDIILAPPTLTPYDTLKAELVRRTSLSEQRRLQQLLTTEELGDKTPSQLLRRMRHLLGNATIEDSLLRQLFLQRLPNDVRMMLASADSATLDDLAKVADRIVDVSTTRRPEVYETTRSPQQPSDFCTAMERRMDQLTEMVAALRPSRSPSQRRSNSPARRRSRSYSPANQQCWYHRTFGSRAQKCTCTAPGNSNASY